MSNFTLLLALLIGLNPSSLCCFCIVSPVSGPAKRAGPCCAEEEDEEVGSGCRGESFDFEGSDITKRGEYEGAFSRQNGGRGYRRGKDLEAG